MASSSNESSWRFAVDTSNGYNCGGVAVFLPKRIISGNKITGSGISRTRATETTMTPWSFAFGCGLSQAGAAEVRHYLLMISCPEIGRLGVNFLQRNFPYSLNSHR